MSKKTTRVVLFILALAIIGAGVGWKMWNKPHAKAEDEKGVTITADELYKEYNTNETTANSKYLQKVLNVSGTAVKQEKNQDGALVVTVQGSGTEATILCTMRDTGATVKIGTPVTMKGFCSGSDMFGPLLTDCIEK